MDSLKSLAPALLSFFHHFEHSAETNPPIPAKSPPPLSPSSLSSHSDSHFVLHSESETDHTHKDSQFFTHTRYDDYPAPDNVSFFNYVHPIYSGSKPPSPPPPTNSAWDFFNFFEPYEKYQVPYVRIGEHDVTEEKEKVKSNETPPKCNTKVSEVQNGEAKNEERKTEQCSESAVKVKSSKGFTEAVKEIQILFQRASDSGNPLLEMIDVGKLRYHTKFDLNPVSSKMMRVLTPSNPMTVKCMESPLLGGRMGAENHIHKGVYKEKELCYANLCSTLKKLCMWEKKLYHEVKAEEKLRMLHQKKCKQLNRMIKKNADAVKIDAVQTFIGILATKMKISIQVVDKISITISKLTEEELWPQINRFILMFLRMWKEMQECYKSQYQEIAEAKAIDVSSFNKKLGNTQIEEAIKLKSEVHKWNLTFSDWIHAQKSQVKALNGWLVRCLMYEPEEISDNSIPFSPEKIGAPPVFVICNKWSRAMDNISEKNVIEAVNGFMVKVNELLEKHVLELQQKMALDKELERKVRMLEREEQKMHKVVKDRQSKMVPSDRGDTAVCHGDVVDTINLQSGLTQIFVAMEGFTATTAQLYGELYQQIKQQDDHDRVLGESNKIH